MIIERVVSGSAAAKQLHRRAQTVLQNVTRQKSRFLFKLFVLFCMVASCIVAMWSMTQLLKPLPRKEIETELHKQLPVNRLYAVVVPIGNAAELVRLRASFRYWRPGREAGGAAPCIFTMGRNRFWTSEIENKPDLVVLSGRALNETARERVTEDFFRTPFCRNCFRSIRLLDCGLKPDQDVYNVSSENMVASRYNGALLNFLCMIGHPQLWTNYHAAFLMETDVAPLRNSWLTDVELEARSMVREQRLAIQSGCAHTENQTTPGWRNGSPALYRLGREALDYYARCFRSYSCIPTVESTCGFFWDAYLATCREGSAEVIRNFSVSCRFVHIGSLSHMQRSSQSLSTALSADARQRAVFIHSSKVLREVDGTMNTLEKQVHLEDIRRSEIRKI
jgi:hypothetical protein